MTTKRGKTCGVEQPLNEYYVLKVGLSGRRTPGHFSECKTCNKARAIAWTSKKKAEAPGEMAERRARYARKRLLRNKYGMSVAEYDERLAAQQHRCAICGTDDPGRAAGFFPVDHDHKTGAVRGLLCHECNLGIAHFADDPDRLLAAAAYLLATRDLLRGAF